MDLRNDVHYSSHVYSGSPLRLYVDLSFLTPPCHTLVDTPSRIHLLATPTPVLHYTHLLYPQHADPEIRPSSSMQVPPAAAYGWPILHASQVTTSTPHQPLVVLLLRCFCMNKALGTRWTTFGRGYNTPQASAVDAFAWRRLFGLGRRFSVMLG